MKPWAVAGAVALAAAILRARGLFSDLWLDEIWSLDGAFAARHWWDVLFRFNVDNNHHLNTLYLFAVGDGAGPVQYRLLAFICGVLSVLAAAAIARRHGSGAGLVAALTFGTSYLLVFYSSEARGYSPVVLFSLLAWFIVQRQAETPKWPKIIALAVCTLAGAMAHRTYGFFLVGAFIWFDYHVQRLFPLRTATRLTWPTFGVPAAVVALFAAVALRHTAVGGGPPYRLHVVLAQTMSSVGSGPTHGALMWTVAAGIGLLFALALIDRWRAGDDRWILYGLTVAVLPLILGLAGRPETLSPRYFIVPAAFGLLAISIFLGHMLERGGLPRLAATLAVGTLVGLGLWRAMDDQSFNRGGYRSAITEMVSGEQGDAVTVSTSERFGGHDFRTKMILDYYRRAVSGSRRLQYFEEKSYPRTGTDWVIVESLSQRPGEPVYHDRYERVFRLHRDYMTSELSGITWHLYRRVDGSAPPRPPS